MLRLIKVRGSSLYPEFLEGDYVLTTRVPFLAGKIQVGDVVVFCQPGFGLLIKRVTHVLDEEKAFNVRGTQVDSTDSRDFGPVSMNQIIGKVIWHIRQ